MGKEGNMTGGMNAGVEGVCMELEEKKTEKKPMLMRSHISDK